MVRIHFLNIVWSLARVLVIQLLLLAMWENSLNSL